MSKMEKKLALLLGVLLFLYVAQFFGADFQVEANETKNSDPDSSSDSGNGGNLNGKSVDSNSNINHTEGKKVKKNKDQLGGVKEDGKDGLDKPKSSRQKKKNAQEGSEGSTDENVGQKEEPKKPENKDGNLKGKSEKGKNNRKSSEEEPKNSHNVEKGKGFSGDEENNKGDEFVGPKKMPDEEGNINQVGESKGDIKSGENESGLKREIESKGDGEEGKGRSSGGKNEEQGAGVGPENVPKETGNSGDECYFSIKCTDEENRLIACLRFPGNENPNLSLLIQNKGNDSLTVNIAAPDFVKLDTTKVKLQKKENKKVEVSIGNGGTDGLIILTAGDRVCNLDFKDLITQDSSPKFGYLGLLARRPIAFMLFSALLIMVSAWVFVSFRRKKLLSFGGFAYQKLNVGLPISVGGKQRLNNNNEGWSESWGDGWDDEEAPRTPSRPSPTLSSSKRLASRRLSKETRKD